MPDTPPLSAEQQLEAVLRLSTGWYWRQDAAFRFTAVSENIAASGLSANFFVGKTRWDVPNTMPQAFWEKHQQAVLAHLPYYELEYQVLGADEGATGTSRWISASGEPLYAADGSFLGYHGFAQDITTRKRARMAVIASERRFDDFVASLSDWLWETDDRLCYTWVSQSVHNVLNLEGMALIGMRLDHFHHQLDADLRATQEVDEALQEHRPFRDFVFRLNNAGREFWLSKSGTPYFHANGRFAGYRGVNRDITHRRVADLQLRGREQRLTAIFQQSPFGMIEWDSDFCATEWNAAAERIFGWSRAEMLGQHTRRLTPQAFHGPLNRILQNLLNEPTQQKNISQNLHKSGRSLTCAWTNAVHYNELGQLIGLVSMVEDLTEQTDTAKRIEHLARHDALTGLPNRAYLLELLGVALADCRSTGRQLAVMMVNMDRFKLINDNLGHVMGDHILHGAAQRLRDQAGPGDTVARLGADEFAVLVTGDASALALQQLGESLRTALGLPYQVESQELQCTASMGVALFPCDGETPSALMQAADSAMTYAKAQGRNNLQFFTISLKRAVEERKALELDLRHAVRRGELVLHYQPQVDALSGVMRGVEALVRWQHPTRGLIGPAHFIPIAEETGLIGEIGNWVLDEACRTLRAWQDQGIAGVCMSVNLSALQLRDPRLALDVAAVLKHHGLDGTALELELTESVAMADPNATIAMLHSLRALGVALAIDDFGTGYSSLSYLKLLPIQRLKLDRSFVKEIESNANDAAICSATIALAHKLKLGVVAEGVETDLQRIYLLSNGCETLQGFLFSRPVPSEDAAIYAIAHP